MTSEYEIMRGDLVDVFYRASLGLNPDADAPEKQQQQQQQQKATTASDSGNVRYEFGLTVTDIAQDASSVTVTFSDGRRSTYDLVVGADGLSSRTRRTILSASDTSFKPLGLFTAYYLVPRGPDDDNWMKWHLMPGRRAIFTRSANRDAPTQVYMSVQTTRAADAYGLASAVTGSSSSASAVVGAQKEAFAAAFADQESWRVPAFVDALRHRTPDDDFYATEIAQVRCERLFSGRVVLLGDAGYCPSPITGMGTTVSLTGAYILAGEIARHGGGGAGAVDVPAALREYESKVRPYVTEAQKLPPGSPDLLYAQSAWGVWFLTTIISLMAKLRLIDLIVRLMPEDKGGLKIPEYPELRLDG
ncbi:hypothetical protein F4859DRAFT_499428 [Xylaria cf. heliscus]|nr:hypothetical protein F4859DRAFT_499428 [Xylaria cf. heliscus]